MDSVEEMTGARIIVETCGKIQPDEDVLIISDWQTATVSERVAAAAKERDANVTIAFMDTPEYDGYSPPSTVASAMMETDVIILAMGGSITHSPETKTAIESGARGLTLTGFEPAHLRSGGLYADFEAMRPKCREMARRFTEADEARVTSDLGTDITFGLEGREGNSLDSIVDQPGTISGIVNIEANIAPVEGTTEGTVVFDGAIPNLGIGRLDDPITMEVDEGAVVSIEGKKEADTIKRAWDEHDDPAVYNIAQLAVGMNPECREFTDWWKDAHAVYGSVHLGIGTSSNLGGTTRAPVHFDAAMQDPTLAFDGEVVVDRGEFTIFD